jgi:hypothetical protein
VSAALLFRESGSHDQASPATVATNPSAPATTNAETSSSSAPSTVPPVTTVVPTPTTQIPTGEFVERFAFGPASASITGIPGPALDARVPGIAAVTTSQGSVVLVADDSVLQITDGAVSVLATTDPAEGTAGGVAVTAQGALIVSTEGGLRRFAEGAWTTLLPAGPDGLGAQPGPVVIDGAGSIYVADNANHRIIRRAPDGALSLIAGSGQAATPDSAKGDGQRAETVALGTVVGMAIDVRGNLVVADADALDVRVVGNDGLINTIGGGGAVKIGSGPDAVAAGTAARDLAFGSLEGLAVDEGGVYVSDRASGAIVRIDSDGKAKAVIAARSDKPIDGVAADQSSVGEAGPLAADPSGEGLLFVDGPALRRIVERR